ncbi:hypothetical protein [Paenibacillus agricola]|uniref:HTH merR-type domain-containing protein n=1 Tax=Paenibacillus agricola TaxID=2716264 RepID=A0ABX0JD65_9BACL|nr:hypothetical protein [Paenibacillus agricola]NHN33196.1 hypothetical protein [Paenibacillus agricola]
MSNYLSQKEMAQKLKKSTNTIRLWVENGMLNSVNPDTYRSDGGYRFTVEEYERLNHLFGPDALFQSEAAELVGITKQYLGLLAKTNPPGIPSQVITYGKQQRRIFRRADCVALKLALEKREHQFLRDGGRELDLYKNNLRLFDSFTFEEKKVVVVSTNPVQLLTENYLIIEPHGYLPISKPCLDLPYEKKTGTIIFSFPRPIDVYAEIIDVLSEMVRCLGNKNIRIFEKEDSYFIRCRKGKIKGSKSDLKLLNKFKVEGYLTLSGDYIELDGEIISKHTNYNKKVYQQIENIANEKNYSFDQTVNFLLSRIIKENNERTSL